MSFLCSKECQHSSRAFERPRDGGWRFPTGESSKRRLLLCRGLLPSPGCYRLPSSCLPCSISSWWSHSKSGSTLGEGSLPSLRLRKVEKRRSKALHYFSEIEKPSLKEMKNKSCRFLKTVLPFLMHARHALYVVDIQVCVLICLDWQVSS